MGYTSAWSAWYLMSHSDWKYINNSLLSLRSQAHLANIWQRLQEMWINQVIPIYLSFFCKVRLFKIEVIICKLFKLPSKLLNNELTLVCLCRTLVGVVWKPMSSTAKVCSRVFNQTCGASRCERNCSVFEQIHMKKRNHLEQKWLNDFVFVQ